jgi:thiol-disulfide isomerase/thioredoxin
MKATFITFVVVVGLGLGALAVVLSPMSKTSSALATSKEVVKAATSDTTATEDEEATIPFVEIQNPSGFVNTDGTAVTIEQYVGTHVILLNVMTYSCINCQRTFPYVNQWYEQYKDEGLIVIGIHTPEFAYEKDKNNVEIAMKKFDITYPVVLDNEYATWKALGNRFWPRKYLIDINGNIVYDHIGEGAYEETEQVIQTLLKERTAVLGT